MRVPSLKSLRAIPDADHAAMRRALKMTRAELLATPREPNTARNASRLRERFKSACTC